MMESIGMDAAPIEVLLVEHSPGDVRFTREGFKDAKVHINLHVASDGKEAMAFLSREGEPFTREEVLEEQFADLLMGLVLGDEIMGWVTDALRRSHSDAKRHLG